MKRFLQLVAVAVLVLAGTANLRAEDNPLVGTWKLNLEKSKFDPRSCSKKSDPQSGIERRRSEVYIRRHRR